MNPQERVQGPAIGLMAVAGIGLLLQVLGVAMNLLGIGVGTMAGGDQGLANMLGGAVGLVGNFIGICIAFVIFVGARKMMRLESYGFAMGASLPWCPASRHAACLACLSASGPWLR